MFTRTFQIVAIIGVLAVGTATLAYMGAGQGEGDGGFFHHLHKLGSHLHGGGHHDHMAELVDQLELTPDQMQRFEKIHEIMASHGSGNRDAMVQLHDSLVEQFESGQIGTAEIRRTIDAHVEEMRAIAYAVTDELVGLINELDGRQRGIVLEHLEGAKARGRGHGH